MATIKIVFHEKLNAIQCVCSYIGTFHECKKEIQGKLSLFDALKKIAAFVKTK